jgi:nucleoside-diphosphate-sugar epimerase
MYVDGQPEAGTSVLVAGGGGFIGGWLVADLLERGYRVRSADVKAAEDWYQVHDGAENVVLDLRDLDACRQAVRGTSQVFSLAADMGGMGFIELNKAACMLTVLINTHLLMAANDEGADRFFYSSSACVYNADKQSQTDVVALKESDAYPAMPEDGYGWEKLFSERMCRHFEEDYGLQTRIARYHNVYGPKGTWDGGREKAPAAISRKVAIAKLTDSPEIEIWGDGEQTRSFTYIDDCVFGTERLTWSDVTEPLNVGSSEMVSINQLVDIVEGIAGLHLERNYLLDAPKGVRGRNSDNTRIRELFDWEPSTTLQAGLENTYAWVYDQVAESLSSGVRGRS